MKKYKHFKGIVKHIKYFNGVPMKLTTPRVRVRSLHHTRQHIKDGHGCTVQVGMLEFHSEHKAKQFIRSLMK